MGDFSFAYMNEFAALVDVCVHNILEEPAGRQLGGERDYLPRRSMFE